MLPIIKLAGWPFIIVYLCFQCIDNTILFIMHICGPSIGIQYSCTFVSNVLTYNDYVYLCSMFQLRDHYEAVVKDLQSQIKQLKNQTTWYESCV